MKLELDLSPNDVVFGQPVQLQLRFVNDGPARPFPTTPSAGPLLRVELLDDEGALREQASGYELQGRRGLEVAPVDPETLTTMTFPAGETMEHREDLLAYLDAPPVGTVGVRVRFDYAPAGLALESPVVPLRIRPRVSMGFDLLVDEVALRTLYLAQTHHDEHGHGSFVQLRPMRAPQGSWSGVSVPNAPPGPATIASAGFRTRATFEHDFCRWLAWWHEGALHLAFVEEHRLGPRSRVALPLERACLLGRPVQHEDRSVSVYVLGTNAEDRSWSIHRVEVGATGARRETEAWRSSLALAEPRVQGSACDHEGRLSVLLSEGDTLPLLQMMLWPGEEPRVQEVLSASALLPAGARSRLLAAGMQAKHEPSRLFVAGLVEGGPFEVPWLWWGDASGAGSEPPAWRVHRNPLAELLPLGDVPVAAAFAHDPRRGLHVVFGSEEGRVLHAFEGERPRTIDAELRVRPGGLALWQRRGELWLAYEREATGVELRRLVGLPG